MSTPVGPQWLAHPLVVGVLLLALGSLVAYLLTERWQRWRQRRDFQYRALVKFSELSEETFNRLSELLMLHGKVYEERHRQLRREYLYRRGPLVAMDGEVKAVFRDRRVFDALVDVTDAMRGLYRMSATLPEVPRSQFQPLQDSLHARREILLTRMRREMRFLSWWKARSLLREWLPKTAIPSDAVRFLQVPDPEVAAKEAAEAAGTGK
ncbi:MAG: hypothetical protein ACREMB_22965 [Candidatus Rokuibacteriota bacterium]